MRCKLCLDKKWRQNNSARYKESMRKCFARNGDKYYSRNKDYKQDRLHSDVEFRLRKNLRARVNNVLKGKPKAGSAIRDLGCSCSELIKYIESLWSSGMSWENYGLKGWHIDHVIPLAKFDLTKENQFKQASHYTNLQPMWSNDNWSKGGR